MAKVYVKGFTVVRDIFGASTISLEVDEPSSVAGVLAGLLERFGEPLKGILCDPATGEVTPFPLRLGDEVISSTSDGSRPVRDGDELTIIFPVGGGC